MVAGPNRPPNMEKHAEREFFDEQMLKFITTPTKTLNLTGYTTLTLTLTLGTLTLDLINPISPKPNLGDQP